MAIVLSQHSALRCHKCFSWILRRPSTLIKSGYTFMLGTIFVIFVASHQVRAICNIRHGWPFFQLLAPKLTSTTCNAHHHHRKDEQAMRIFFLLPLLTTRRFSVEILRLWASLRVSACSYFPLCESHTCLHRCDFLYHHL